MRIAVGLLTCLCIGALSPALAADAPSSRLSADQATAKRLIREGYRPLTVRDRNNNTAVWFCRRSDGFCTTIANERAYWSVRQL